MTIEFLGIEFTECTYIPQDETERTNGLLIHDLTDIEHDGDGVMTGFGIPCTEDEARSIIDSDEFKNIDRWCETLSTVDTDDQPSLYERLGYESDKAAMDQIVEHLKALSLTIHMDISKAEGSKRDNHDDFRQMFRDVPGFGNPEFDGKSDDYIDGYIKAKQDAQAKIDRIVDIFTKF